MAINDFTAEQLQQRLTYDPETGLFAWVPGCTRRFPNGGPAGVKDPEGYIRISVFKRFCMAHRLAWLQMTGMWPVGQIDHINGIRSDNRFCNLRDVDPAMNAQNRRAAHKSSTHGYLDASLNRKTNRWVAKIDANGKRTTIGTFATPQEAHEAYMSAKRRLHQGCTV